MATTLRFDRDGAELFPNAAMPFMAALEDFARTLPADEAGIRLTNQSGLRPLLQHDALGRFARDRLGVDSQPVRAILFDKTASGNWALGWHQDRTIAVRQRIDTVGFGPWSLKASIQHTEPPFALIERMITMRVHLDAVPSTNAPLKIALGSHCCGRIPEDNIDAVVNACGTAICLAERSDIWLYATPIVHASGKSAQPSHRRVLQVDFSADRLPSGLEWLGV